jgi:hypothetical protein
MDTSAISNALRKVPPKRVTLTPSVSSAVVADTTPRPVPPVKGPLIELVKRHGKTECIYVRTRGKVKTLHVVRDTEDAIVSLFIEE